MKGLLIKDIRLLQKQKTLLVVALCFLVLMGFTLGIGYTSVPSVAFFVFFAAMSALSTINYDKFDNGFSFLFTLPITPKMYVQAKYLLIFLFGGATWLFISGLLVAHQYINNMPLNSDTYMNLYSIGISAMLLVAITVPSLLRFGQNTTLIGLFIAALTFVLLMNFRVNTASSEPTFLASVVETMGTWPIAYIALLVFFLTLLVIFISYKISVRIMQRKEF